MEDTLVLKYNGTSLTTFIDDDGEPWWLDEEVCDFLGIEDISAAMNSLEGDEKMVYPEDEIIALKKDKNNRMPIKLGMINESGLTSLVMQVGTVEARDFGKWVAKKVLPEVSASYECDPVDMDLTELEIMSVAFKIHERIIKELTDRLDKLTDKIEALSGLKISETVH